MYNRQIETYIQVVECGSLSKASEKLYISTVSVMNQVNALEDRVGVKLLNRTNKGIVLTDAGRSIYSDARRIITECDEAFLHARQLAGNGLYTIRIGSSMLNPCNELIHAWEKIRNKNPQYKIKIVPFDDNREAVLDSISALGSKYDFIVAVCGSNQWQSLCHFYEIGKLKKCVAVSRSHHLADRQQLEIEDLYGEKIMLVKRGDSPENGRLRDFLEKNHPKITIIDTSYFYDIDVFNECEESGYVLTTYDTWTNVHPSLVTIPVNWDFSVPYGIMSAKDPSKNAAAFLEAIKTVYPPPHTIDIV